MFMSVVAGERGVSVHPEIAGSRVMITGLTPAMGVDVARAFADHKARLVVQAPEAAPEIDALAVVLSETASNLCLTTGPFADGDAAVRFTQSAAKAAGGLDVVINLVAVSREEMGDARSEEEIEDLVSEKLLSATLITRVAANRMRLTLGSGLVLNVVLMPEPETAAEAAVAGIMRSALAAMTRGEAQQWADQAVRINAIGPRAFPGMSLGACLTSEPDIAALALHLASKKGRQLSGHVFDAAGVSRGC